MEVGVQVNNLKMLQEAIKSNCNNIRFGSEFCMFRVPSMDQLKEAYLLTKSGGKKFSYVVPRLSDNTLTKIQKHLAFLNKVGKIIVAVNDLGALHILNNYAGLKPHLGRQLVYMPARCPWGNPDEFKVGFFVKRKIEKLFYKTSLHYKPTIKFFKNLGVQGADVDYIPQCLPHFGFIVRNGINLSVHLHVIPATITRKCHMARFLGERNLEQCSKPCDTVAFRMKNDSLGDELLLEGNVVFRSVIQKNKDIGRLHNLNVSEIVITMTPLTGIENHHEIDKFVKNIMTK
jgi:hypothetical protein